MWNKFRMLWNLCGVPQSIGEFCIDSAKIPHAPEEFRICYAEFRMCDAEIWGTGRSGQASFYAGTKSLFIFKKGFSQLTYKDFLQNGGETVENNRNPAWKDP